MGIKSSFFQQTLDYYFNNSWGGKLKLDDLTQKISYAEFVGQVYDHNTNLAYLPNTRKKGMTFGERKEAEDGIIFLSEGANNPIQMNHSKEEK